MKSRTVVSLLALLAGQIMALTGVSAQTVRGNGLIVDVGWLAEQASQDHVVILQVGPPELFAEEHVPGARHVTHRDISTSGDLAMELPAVEELRGILAELGIRDDSRIVVVHSGAWITPSTRLVFTLDYAGFGGQTYVLDGGLEAWKAAGMPVTATVAPVQIGAVSKPVQNRVVTHEWVRAHSRDEGVSLIDARASAFYDGVREDDGSVGHIGGALSMPWQEIIREEDGIVWFRPDAEIAEAFEAIGVGGDDLVVGYCHIGQFATGMLFGARVSGHDVRLFDGSMNQWRKLGLPLTTEGN